jgi:hypothetical protein
VVRSVAAHSARICARDSGRAIEVREVLSVLLLLLRRAERLGHRVSLARTRYAHEHG